MSSIDNIQSQLPLPTKEQCEEFAQYQDRKWQELSPSEQDMISGWNDRRQLDTANELTELPVKVANFVQLEVRETSLYSVLQENELNKIRAKLKRLCELSETKVQICR